MTPPLPDTTAETSRAAVVYNPGKVDPAQLRALVGAAEAEAGWAPAIWLETAADDNGRAAAVAALAAQPSVVIVAGGDGTVRIVAQQLAGSTIPLAVAAAGTGNLLARELGLPVNDLAASIQLAFAGRIRPIDVGDATLQHADGTVSAHTFLVMAGIGLDARMAVGTNARLKKHLGWLAYADPIGRSIIANADFAVHYRLDDSRTRSTRAHTVIVGNCGTLTGGMLLIPDARPDDGVLDAVILRPRGAGGWAQIGLRLGFARFLHRTSVGSLLRQVIRQPYAMRFVRARRISVGFNTPQEVELDGDGFGPITGAMIAVRPNSLRLLAPQQPKAKTKAKTKTKTKGSRSLRSGAEKRPPAIAADDVADAGRGRAR